MTSAMSDASHATLFDMDKKKQHLSTKRHKLNPKKKNQTQQRESLKERAK